MKKQKFLTQTILFQTHLFGKDYFWMQDVDGTIYLAKSKPVYEGYSISPTGEKTPILVGHAPDLT